MAQSGQSVGTGVAQPRPTAHAAQAAAVGVAGGVGATSAPETELLSAKRVKELLQQLDMAEQIDIDVTEALQELAEEFVENATAFAAKLAKHRGSTTLEAGDLQVRELRRCAASAVCCRLPVSSSPLGAVWCSCGVYRVNDNGAALS